MCEHNDIQTLDPENLRVAKDKIGWGTLALIQGHVWAMHSFFSAISPRFEKAVDRHVSARSMGQCDGGNLGKTNCGSFFTSQQRG